MLYSSSGVVMHWKYCTNSHCSRNHRYSITRWSATQLNIYFINNIIKWSKPRLFKSTETTSLTWWSGTAILERCLSLFCCKYYQHFRVVTFPIEKFHTIYRTVNLVILIVSPKAKILYVSEWVMVQCPTRHISFIFFGGRLKVSKCHTALQAPLFLL